MNRSKRLIRREFMKIERSSRRASVKQLEKSGQPVSSYVDWSLLGGLTTPLQSTHG
jgi:hypothetical protein